MKRRAIPKQVKLDVLTEAGYQCAVPTCRTILSLDIHHIDQGTAPEARSHTCWAHASLFRPVSRHYLASCRLFRHL